MIESVGNDMAIWKRLVASVLLLQLLLGFGTSVAQTEPRVALVIGNGNYTSVGKLKNPENDATAMAAMLRRVGFDVIERENVSRRAMIQATRTFAEKLSPGGIGLLYYAGHGIQAQGADYLVPVDAMLAVEDDLKYETLNLQDILDKLDDARVRLSIVILDACRDNPFKSFRSSVSGLALINPPAGTVIAYATAPGKVAGDGTGDNSIFTAELLKAMGKPDKLLDVFAHVTDAVERLTANVQTPWINSSFRGDFYFTGPTTGTTTPAPDSGTATTSSEIVFWQSIAGSTNPADFEAYLKQFPDGSFVALARIRLASLALHPMPVRPSPASEPRPADVKISKANPAPAAKQKPVAVDPADIHKTLPASKEFALAAPPNEPQPVQQAATPSPSPSPAAAGDTGPQPRNLGPPNAVPSQNSQVVAALTIHDPTARPTQEAMIRPPSAGDGQPSPDAIPPRSADPAPKPEPSRAVPFCRIPRFTGMDSLAGAYATIRVANTGDRCGAPLKRKPLGMPFDSLSLSRPPRHGSVTLEGSAFYYTPSPGFVGIDDFAIVSSPWGSVRAVVTVVPPEPAQR
jgi:hypothetical protein